MSFVHAHNLRQIETEYQPAIRTRELDCAGLVFLNRYLMSVLARLEPNHPLLDVGFREKVARWGAFTFSDAPGSRSERYKAAGDAGHSFSIPKFETRGEMVKRTEANDPYTQDVMARVRQFTTARRQWLADMKRGIVAPEPQFQVVRRPSQSPGGSHGR